MMKMEMTDEQKMLLAQIEAEKAKAKPDLKLIGKLARRMAAVDDVSRSMKFAVNVRHSDTRGGRSACFGRWDYESTGERR